ncbi:hypothetical protein, partial [Pseudomonas aeruginosa]|uniref:hypothetical protein n=1 Tax=Pseudomonas aeruginosa TaxID=287 RepID=UPI00188ED196
PGASFIAQIRAKFRAALQIPPQEKTSNLLTTCAKNAMFRPRCTRTAQSEQFATARQYNQEIAA